MEPQKKEQDKAFEFLLKKMARRAENEASSYRVQCTLYNPQKWPAHAQSTKLQYTGTVLR